MSQQPSYVDSEYVLKGGQRGDGPFHIEGVDSLPELFRWQASRSSDARLFSFQKQPDGPLTVLTYGTVYRIASRLATTLHNQYLDFDREQPRVGIWFEKSIDLHLAILAVTASGAAWLPFDADAPAARVTACLADSGASVLLCDAVHYDAAVEAVSCDNTNCRVVLFEDLDKQSQEATALNSSKSSIDPNSTAYIIYTSGSTGTPKGIEISHRAALTFCLSERSILETGPSDVVWQGFSPAFDMFIEETWVSIAGGAQLAIGSRAECQNVPGLGGPDGIWANRGVTLVNAVPTLISIMTSLDDACSLPASMRLLNLGGEACPPSLVKKLWRPNLRIVNTYGPSETTVTATFQDLLPDEPVTIGKPLPMYHALILPILDSVPRTWSPLALQEGVEGELAIGGTCLGKGYVGRPTLTSEKFIRHPLADKERLYRTGDRVCLDQSLNIVFLGRIDTQVKHRGFRIELGEIENGLTAHPGVQMAAVILSTATDQLEAYVVVEDGVQVEVKDMRASVRHLPSYMAPEAIYVISADEMPRLPSGKINARALQDLSAARRSREETEKPNKDEDAAEDNSDMGLLLRTMAEVFPQATNMTQDSDFFEDLGGHSLAAAMLVSKLRKSTGSPLIRRLALQDIYIHRTARLMLAKLVEDDSSRSRSSSDDDDDDDDDNKKSSSGRKHHITTEEDRWAVSPTLFILCGMAQVPALLFFFCLSAIATFGPYLVFYAILQTTTSIGYAILAAYLAFVAVPIVNLSIGLLGKWITLGKATAGEYPVYGVYYYRWWLAERFVHLIDFVSVAETPLLPFLLRCLGAKVGVHCHAGTPLVGAVFDLLSIGDDVVIGRDVALSTSWVERGRLVLAPVRIESGASVGTQSVLEGGSSIEEDGEMGPLTMLPSGCSVPTGERWVGCPAQFDSRPCDIGHMKSSRPSFVRMAVSAAATSLTSVFILPLMYFLPQIPSILFFEYISIPGLWTWAQTAVVAVPAAAVYFLLVFLELVVFKWLVLGRVRERSYRATSLYNYRKWLVGRLMDMSLVILHPVYATLYVVPFLRSLGVKIGHMAEVSTARGVNFELSEIGDESFIADGVFMGDRDIRANTVTLQKTVLAPRAFAGNSSIIPQGTVLPSNSLVGVLSIAPTKVPLKERQSCFGSPPVLMPRRQSTLTNHPDHVLYAPTRTLVATRLIIEGMRIFMPRLLLIFGLGFGTQVFILSYENIGVAGTVLMLPFYHFFLFALPCLLFTALCKWILIGRYTHAEWPLWSVNVWKSELVTAVYETVAVPLLTNTLTGTPFLAWAFRLLGVSIGSRATLLSTDITEYDMVTIGDEAVVNRHAHPQTHLFEDRIMKIGTVDIGAGACLKTYSHALPNSSVGANARLGSLSLVMKGETVPAGEVWEGDPIAPARRRYRG